jgi:hypothetical protein
MVGRYFRPCAFQEFTAPDLKATAGSRDDPAPVDYHPRYRLWFAIEQRRSVTQIVARKPVRAVAANLVISFANLAGRNTPETQV